MTTSKIVRFDKDGEWVEIEEQNRFLKLEKVQE